MFKILLTITLLGLMGVFFYEVYTNAPIIDRVYTLCLLLWVRVTMLDD